MLSTQRRMPSKKLLLSIKHEFFHHGANILRKDVCLASKGFSTEESFFWFQSLIAQGILIERQKLSTDYKIFLAIADYSLIETEQRIYSLFS